MHTACPKVRNPAEPMTVGDEGSVSGDRESEGRGAGVNPRSGGLTRVRRTETMEPSAHGELATAENWNRQAMAMNHDDETLRGLSSRETMSDDELYFRHHPFTKQFITALHSLLISCSRQEVSSYFPQFQPRYEDFLYRVFTLAVTQIRKTAIAKFQSICKETQVLETLDYIDSEEFRRALAVRPSAPPKEVVREVAVKRKQEEVDIIKQELQQTREKNALLATQLEGLREKVNSARKLRSVDAVVKKVSKSNLKMERIMR